MKKFPGHRSLRNKPYVMFELAVMADGVAKDRIYPIDVEQLGCGGDDLLHVSASLRYDLTLCWGLGIRHKVYVNRGYEPSTRYYGYHEVSDIGGLATLLRV